MNLTVEWVEKETRFRSAVAYRYEYVPVIRVDALRRWFQGQVENGATIDDIFLQLPEEK